MNRSRPSGMTSARQLALLTAALAGLVGLARAIAAELRDRSRRRRRNAVHVIANKLVYWPGKPRRSPSAGRRMGRVAGVAAAAVLAGASWASASGPLLEPSAGRGAANTDAASDRTESPAGTATGRPPRATRSIAQRRAESARERGGSKRSRRDRDPVATTAPAASQPPVATAPAATAPPVTTPAAASEPPATDDASEGNRSDDGARKRRRREKDRPGRP